MKESRATRPPAPPAEAPGSATQASHGVAEAAARDATRAGALPVALIYASFGGLWILVSDKAVEALFDDANAILTVSMLKGWLFVGITALLLYLLLRRRGAPGAVKVGAGGTAGDVLPLVLLTLGIVVLAGLGIANSIRHQHEVEVSRLQAVAKLKVRQIADWLAERRRDAEFLQGSSYIAGEFRRWQAGEAEAGRRLQQRLDQFRANRGFGLAVLLDPAGRPLWSSDGGRPEMAPALQRAVAKVAAGGAVERIGPYADATDKPHLDYVVPLVADGEPHPYVVLHVDLDAWFYPALQDWPLPSPSGETLLVRRDGDEVQFLNELRHRRDTALRQRLPLSSPDLLAAKALRGGVADGATLDGTDYRGTPAFGVVRAVPGTDWLLIAKLDSAELHAATAMEAIWIGFAGLLALFLAAVGLALLRQRNQLAFAAATQQAQTERMHALQLLEAVAAGSNDAIFAQDLEGRFTLFNRACERITGVPAALALGRDESALFPAEDAASRLAANRRVIERGESEVVEESIPRSDGSGVVFLTTKAPLYDDRGRIIGMFGIARDITARKRQEEELQARNAELERFNRASVGRELDMIDLKKRVNALERELGRAPSFPLAFEEAAGGTPRP